MEYREFRAEVAEEGNKLSGIAAPFGSETTIGDLNRGGWREEIAPGAFTKALRESDTVLLCDHDMSKPLARVSAGTLRMHETASELRFDADVVDTSYARDLMANIRAGNKGGMSIGFQPVKDDWFDDQGKPSNRHSGTKRVIREVKLPEASCVTNPAYKDTAVYARDDSAALLEERAAAVGEKDRKDLAAKGHALPGGEYPIPDIAHLHAAAILAASHHGDWQAAQELIRKRAPELGVDVKTLPGFEGDDEKKSADVLLESAALLVSAYNALPADVRSAAEDMLREQRSDQEPEASTPDDDADAALRDKEMLRKFRSRDLGYVEK